LEENDEIECINPISEMKTDAEIESPNTVKVARNLKGRAVFFSRSPIPWAYGKKRTYPVYRQVPILGFRREFCLGLARLEAGPLEVQESIDMLCAIEHDMAVHTMLTEYQTIGVDTPRDLENVVIAMKEDVVYERYKNK
jgi:3-deoxy-manno-octulosonate cytidylyltransferase (CMP-KDO synthetase)